ncbi:MAG: DUF4339 domain-containing protein [Armatimonadota bacterium]|nr:MAG: DUF4339 domain-containing protein [Armatimonadota bacterium]
MQARSISAGRALSVGFDAFKRYPGLLIGVSVLYFVLAAVGQNIPIVGFLYGILVQPPIVGGLVIFVLNVINDRNPTVGDLFAGFQRFGTWMGAYWLLTAISLACFVPGLILVGIGAVLSRSGEDEMALILAIVLGAVVSLVIVIAVTLRWMFVYYSVAEGRGTMDAFKRSAQITEGVRPQLLWAGIVLGLFSIAGVIALGVGIIVTFPIAMCAFASIYRDLEAAAGPAPGAIPPYGPSPTETPTPGPAPATPWAEPTPTVIHAPGAVPAPTTTPAPAQPEPTPPAPPPAQPEPAPPAPAPPPPPPAPAVQWYFAVGGQRVGPLSQDDLTARIQAGEVTRETLVWRAGMSDWLPAAQTPELAPLLSQPPGASPPISA